LPSEVAEYAQQAMIQAAQSQVLRHLSGQYSTTARFRYMPALALTVDATAFRGLQESALVVSVEPDRISTVSLFESAGVIGASTGWNMGYDGRGWTVAILDTGVQKTHPFLTGRVVSEACYANLGMTNTTSFCPGGGAASTEVGSGMNCPPTISGCDHGTHVAGIAAGKNGTTTVGLTTYSFSGVARNATIIAMQVFQGMPCSGNPSVTCIGAVTSSWLQGLERVYELRDTYHIAAVNLSLGSDLYATTCNDAAVQAAVNNLRSVGIATVVAAGNNSAKDQISFPACIPNVISVGSATKRDEVAADSNASSFMSLWAPGVSITSSVLDNFVPKSGTSMAAPQVAGMWAVLKQQTPSASVDDILSLINNTGLAVRDYRSGGTVTKQRGQLDNALHNLSGALTNDAKATPRVLPDTTWYSLAHTMKGSTTTGTDVKPTCNGAAAYNNTVWFTITPTVSGSLTLSTDHSNFDTVLSVYVGANEIACNNQFGGIDTSRVTFSATAGVTYAIMVANYGGALATNSNPFIKLTLWRNMRKPTLVAPTVVANALTPTYRWGHLPSAEAYQLLVIDLVTGTSAINNAYLSESLCAAQSCQITPTTTLVNNRGYAWYAAAYRADSGWGPYSDPQTFIASVPLASAPTQLAPEGVVTDTLTPTYSWTSVTGAVSYYVVIYDLDTLTLKHAFSVEATACSGGTCQTTPVGAAATLLNGGTYGWYVAALNYAGASPWSNGAAFIPFVRPAVPTTISPSGLIGISSPTYTWDKAQGATFYYLTTVNSSGMTVVGEWVAAAICGASTCSHTPSVTHTDGSYLWYVLAANPAGMSVYSTGRAFTVGSTAPNIAPPFAPSAY
jgi:hypothetical protein